MGSDTLGHVENSQLREDMSGVGPVLSQDGPGEFRCPECGNRCTRGPDGTEYGHRRHPDCPDRPSENVDPVDRLSHPLATWPPGDDDA